MNEQKSKAKSKSKSKPQAKAKSKARKYLLYVRPGKPPAFWPRTKRGTPCWVGVFKGGIGWVVGDGDVMSEADMLFAQEIVSYDLIKPQFREVAQ